MYTVFNLTAWGLDCLGDILNLALRRHYYLLGMVVAVGVSSGLTPIVYIIGGWEHVTRAHRKCLGHQEYFLIELFLVFCKLIWSVPRPLGDSRKIKKNKKIKKQKLNVRF